MAKDIRPLGTIDRTYFGDNIALYEKDGCFVINWPGAGDIPISLPPNEAAELLTILQKWLEELA